MWQRSGDVNGELEVTGDELCQWPDTVLTRLDWGGGGRKDTVPLFLAFIKKGRKGKEGVGIQRSFETSKIFLGSDGIWPVCRLMGMARWRGKNSKWKRGKTGSSLLEL